VSAPLDPQRRAELVATLAAVRGRLVDACVSVNRDVRTVTMIAVTKGFPASDVLDLAALGVTDFGESRDQEAKAKLAEVEREAPDWQPQAARWHFVGKVQTNKCRSIAGYASVVHSVDRAPVVSALAAGAERAERTIDVFAQVSLDGDPARGGVVGDQLTALADQISAAQSLRLVGVMAIAPLGVDPDSAFERLAAVSAGLRERHPDATSISAGMSADFEAAIRHGATHVRIGTALLGRREGTFG
jgi:pyridoxal phosphate enzyme (YggS family)